MNQNAVSLLLEQHDRIRRLFDDVESAAFDDRRVPFESLVALLTMHETAEQQVVYPALQALSEPNRLLAVEQMRDEMQAKRDLVELRRMGPSSPDFELAFKSFRSAVEAHADREEAEVFPELLKTFDETRLQELATALRACEQAAAV